MCKIKKFEIKDKLINSIMSKGKKKKFIFFGEKYDKEYYEKYYSIKSITELPLGFSITDKPLKVIDLIEKEFDIKMLLDHNGVMNKINYIKPTDTLADITFRINKISYRRNKR